jgi:deoxyribodipyrimidine photolyase
MHVSAKTTSAAHHTYRVVWFKRDLRVHDHAALAQAAAHGPVLCLYVLEPRLWAQPDAAACASAAWSCTRRSRLNHTTR